MPSDEILNDPGWQAFHAFRWICDFLGHPQPGTPLGFDLKLEVREVSAGEGEKLRALFAKGTPDKWTPEGRRSVFPPGFRLFE